MKKYLYTIAITLCAILTSSAQGDNVLRFNQNGEFKIVQFTDTHYKWNNKKSDSAVECIKSVIETEKPDFIIITGDLVYSDSVRASLPALLSSISDSQTPFAVVFGNHDNDFDCTLPEIYDIIQAMPYNVQPPRLDVDSPDYELPILSSDGMRTASVLYCIDSHDTNKMKCSEKHGKESKYDWIKHDQINWYRTTSNAYKAANDSMPLPSLMFFHIPLHEFKDALKNRKIKGNNKENVCHPAFNSGMFVTIKEQGDVMGVFCGHDHDNDYAVMYHDIMLAYGRYSGGKTVYNSLGTNGARVIVLKENERYFDTWIRLRTGEIVYKTNYPEFK